MPRSEAHLDTPRDLVRLRFRAFTGAVRGIAFVDGVAQNGCPPHEAERLRGIFGPVIEVVGPWEAPAAPVSEPVVEPTPPPPPIEPRRFTPPAPPRRR